MAHIARNITLAASPLDMMPLLSPPPPVFVVGDFNARHVSWDPFLRDVAHGNHSGKLIHRHLLAPTAQAIHPTLPRLTLLNTHFTTSRHVTTHTSNDTDSVIDLAMCTTQHVNMVRDVHVLTEAHTASDHFPLMLSFHPPAVMNRIPVRIPSPPPPSSPAPSPRLGMSEEELESKYDDVPALPSSSDTPGADPDMPALIKRTSTIPGGGNGLYANRDYRPGEPIIQYTGEVLDEKQKQARYPNNDAQYVMYVKSNMYIDAVDPARSSLARYINTGGRSHNNARPVSHHHNGKSGVTVKATKHIRKGDEIFMPYGRGFHHFTFTPPPPKPRAPRTRSQAHQQQHASSQSQASEPAHAHGPGPPRPPNAKRARWNITNTTDWRVLQAYLKPKLQEWIDLYQSWSGNNTPHTLTQAQINACWQSWLDVILDAADNTIGAVQVPPNSKEWWQHIPNMQTLHDTYRKARRVCRAVRRRGRVSPSPVALAQTRAAYLKAKGAFLTAVQKGKRAYWDGMVAAIDQQTSNNKHKPFWARLKRVMPSTQKAAASFPDSQGAPPLTPQHAIDNMASHLAQVSSLTPHPSHDKRHERVVMDYLRDHVPNHSNVSEPPPFTPDEVKQACLRFRLNTALGSDNVAPHFLIHGGDLVPQSLFMLFSIFWRHGMVPSSFRHGHVVTLYKGEGEVNDPNNYRPITITSVVSRLYERVQVKSLLAAMSYAGMPSPDQFGFTAKRSCHDAIYRLLSLIVETIDKASGDSRYVPAVFIDISKAYDKVWLEGLLYKLHRMGVRGNLYYSIRSLLLNRTIQVVSADGTISQTHTLTAGVPQGSILAPFLFLIYIHGIIANVSPTVCMSLFADDIGTLPLIPGPEGIAPLQSALTSMSRYASKWKITFSAKKTNVVYFHPHITGRSWKHPQYTIKLGGFNITTAKQYIYLGVVLDSLLTFIPHACNTIKTVARTAQLISRLVRRDSYPSFPVIQTLVKCILVPQLTYGFPFFSVKNKAIKTGQTLGNNPSTRANLHARMKCAMLRPLLFSLGLPHHTNHHSVFIESRLFDVSSLFTLCSARLAHRWLNIKPGSSNSAGALFYSHTTNRPRSPFHPFNVLYSNISRVPTLAFLQDDDGLVLFSELQKKQLKSRVWSHQYNAWRAWRSRDLHEPAILSQYYPTRPVPQDQLPFYLHHDHPHTASHRARLRFGRALLLQFMLRFRFKDAPNPAICANCHTNSVESVNHIITSCTHFTAERIKLTHELDRAAPASSPWHVTKLSLHDGPVVAPEMFVDSDPKKHLSKVLYITGKFIDHIQKERKF